MIKDIFKFIFNAVVLFAWVLIIGCAVTKNR